MSAIMKQPGSKIPLRAHFDRQRVETVHVGRSPPQLSMRTVAKMAKIDPEKKRSPDQVDPFLERLHDETCSQCRPPSDPKVPSEWHHVPWDEVELKKHSLMDKQCHHIANALVPDEVEMKKLGMVDSEGHHNVARQMDEETKRTMAAISRKAHEQLGQVCVINKNSLECKKRQPHIKIQRNVEVVDDAKPKSPPSLDSPSTSTTMLTARGSAPRSSSSERTGPPSERQKPSEPARGQKSPLSTRLPPVSILTASPKVNVTIRPSSGVVATVNGKPIAITKMVETADGQFEFNINFEVRFKPKTGAAEADKSPQPM